MENLASQNTWQPPHRTYQINDHEKICSDMEVSIDNHPHAFVLSSKMAFWRMPLSAKESKLVLSDHTSCLHLQKWIHELEKELKAAQESILEYQQIAESL